MTDQFPHGTPVFRGSTAMLLFAGIVLAAFILLVGGQAWTLQVPFRLLLGWISYLVRVLPQVSPDWPTIMMACVLIVVFAAGTHGFLKWLVAAIPSAAQLSWSPRHSLAVVALVLLTFVVGISMVGITHQIAWMATSKQPLMQNSFREVVSRQQSQNNLREMALGIVNYHDEHGELPLERAASPDETPRWGWQVQILPHMERGQRFDRIAQQEAWDSEANRSVFQSAVQAYQNPGARRQGLPATDGQGYVLSDYAANEQVFGRDDVRRFGDVTDGLSHTILLGEVTAGRKPWGAPGNWRDPAMGIGDTPTQFHGPLVRFQVTQFGFADGHAEAIDNNIDPEVLRALATPNAGDEVAEW